jgi:hypothetical protein
MNFLLLSFFGTILLVRLALPGQGPLARRLAALRAWSSRKLPAASAAYNIRKLVACGRNFRQSSRHARADGPAATGSPARK